MQSDDLDQLCVRTARRISNYVACDFNVAADEGHVAEIIKEEICGLTAELRNKLAVSGLNNGARKRSASRKARPKRCCVCGFSHTGDCATI